MVDSVNNFVYRVRPAAAVHANRDPITAHIVRIRRFSNAALGTDADTRAIEQAAIRDFPDCFPQAFHTHRHEANRGICLRVRWLGFDRAMDTWEPIANLAQSHPDMVEDYLRGHPDDTTTRLLRRFFP